jgi:hypothetical protein
MDDNLNLDLKSLVTAIATDNTAKAEQSFHTVLQAKMQAMLAKKAEAPAAESTDEAESTESY